MEFPLMYGLEKVGLPLICTTDDLIFLIDTGANHSVLFTFIYEYLKDSLKEQDDARQMVGMEGNKVDVNKVEGTINILDKDYTHTFSVYDGSKIVSCIQERSGVQIHGILGMDFIVRNKWILDFERFVVIEKEENVNSQDKNQENARCYI